MPREIAQHVPDQEGEMEETDVDGEKTSLGSRSRHVARGTTGACGTWQVFLDGWPILHDRCLFGGLDADANHLIDTS